MSETPRERARRAKSRAVEVEIRLRELREQGAVSNAETLARAADAAAEAAAAARRGYLRAGAAMQRAAKMHDRMADTLEQRAGRLGTSDTAERDDLLRRAEQHRQDAARDRTESEVDQARADELHDADG